MDLQKILSVSGRPGLYKMVGQTKNGAIVESFIDQKRFPVFATDKASTLKDIVVFTSGEDMPLVDVFKKIYDKHAGGVSIDSKSDDKTLHAYFAEVLPEYDKERVHTSDIKKMISWYNLLHEYKELDFTEEEKKEEAETPEVVAEEKPIEPETKEEEK
jgi:hypothetical protein